MPGGFFGHLLRLRRAVQRRQATGIDLRQRLDEQMAHLPADAIPRRRQPRRRLDGSAHGGHQTQRRRVRRAHDLGEQRQAVVVGPLQIVDDQEERALARHDPQELTHRAEQSPALRRRLTGIAVRGRLGAGQLAQDRKRLRQQRQRRHHHVGVLRARQITAQRIDDSVDSLIGHRLALVAAAAQHHHLGLRRAELRGELPHQRALADAGLALHEDRCRLLGRRGGERVGQKLPLPRPPHERRAPHHQLDLVEIAERTQDFIGGRAILRARGQEPHAQGVELDGNRRRQGDGRRRQVRLFLLQHLGRRAQKRRPPDERLIKQHAHRIPIGRRAHGQAGRLLGSHV